MEIQVIQNRIYEVRGAKVMLDYDLANMYGTETRILKQAVRRNLKRFPPDFMFELTRDELNLLVISTLSQNVIPPISNFGGHAPFAFTEQGVAMLSSVLKSDVAIDVNILIMRAFVASRNYILMPSSAVADLDDLKKQIKQLYEDIESINKDHEGYEQHFDDIYLALAQLAGSQKQINSGRTPIGYKSNKEDQKN